MNGSDAFIIIMIGVSIAVFLICREIVTWYFKLNRIVSLLEEINGKLSTLPQQTMQDTTPAHIQPVVPQKPIYQQETEVHLEQQSQYRKNPLTNR
jgi:hypothetical protein